MPTVVIDGIATRYEVIGSGPPILMYAPGGFNAVAEAWSTLGIYQKIKLLDHLPAHLFRPSSCRDTMPRTRPRRRAISKNACRSRAIGMSRSKRKPKTRRIRTCSNFCAP
jgi:hypothetical protein